VQHDHAHTSHPQVINRLKRAGGHLNNVVGLIEKHRPCAEIVQQLHAVERAINAAKRALIHDHLDHCLGDAVKNQPQSLQSAVGEFRELSKYL
jgi:DNA-binding FrmR family transcriptional regulator